MFAISGILLHDILIFTEAWNDMNLEVSLLNMVSVRAFGTCHYDLKSNNYIRYWQYSKIYVIS